MTYFTLPPLTIDIELEFTLIIILIALVINLNHLWCTIREFILLRDRKWENLFKKRLKLLRWRILNGALLLPVVLTATLNVVKLLLSR